MKTAVFLTIRTDSSRLPNKTLMKIGFYHIIELCIFRAKQVHADEVVLCTTYRKVDDYISMLAKNLDIKVYRGSLEDKLERWFGAAKTFNIDYFVTFDGDDLLCDTYLMNMALIQAKECDCDMIKAPEGLICGAFTYCIKTDVLETIISNKKTNKTEMIMPLFEGNNLDIRELRIHDPIYFNNDIRLTLDYIEDFYFFEKIFSSFEYAYLHSLETIIPFLLENPDIIKINSFRRKDFLNNQAKLIKKEGNSV